MSEIFTITILENCTDIGELGEGPGEGELDDCTCDKTA